MQQHIAKIEFQKINKGSCGLGVVANIHGIASHKILEQGLLIVKNLEHRGATGQDQLSGDGAGLMIDIADQFFRAFWQEKDIILPVFGDYAVGMCFFSCDRQLRARQQKQIEAIIAQSTLRFIGWREVPTDNSSLSPNDLHLEPSILQLFVAHVREDYFEQQVYLLRKKIKQAIKDDIFEIVSFSSQTLIYKGLFLASQLAQYYLDFKQQSFQTSFALLHQRFSTNTLPSWKLAQPLRLIAHNGEINTCIGNINSCNARESQMRSKFFSSSKALFPIIEAGCSDSLGYDNFLEFLVQNGISLVEAMMMMMPQSWENETKIQKNLKSFYEYHTPMLEPWDGPAAILFANKNFIGAAVDRNGLRPLRYCLSKDCVVIASESGVLPMATEQILQKGKLGAGEILALDRKKGKILYDTDLKESCSNAHPYAKWNKEHKVYLSEGKKKTHQKKKVAPLSLKQQQKVFFYSEEDLSMLFQNMAETSEELTYAMGTDTPLAILSEKPQLLYGYFKQRFAQVTNPPIDPIREQCNMSLESYVINDFNLLEKTPKNAKVFVIENPIVTRQELMFIQAQKKFSCHKLSMLYDYQKQKLSEAVAALCEQSLQAVKSGASLLVLSDKQVSSAALPIPALLAVSAVHHHLIVQKERKKIGLILETGEARETHHFALLLGYGATAVCPYLAYETIADMAQNKQLSVSQNEALANYVEALSKGLRKIMSKMGISTLNSYQGAQVFEAIGLSKELIQKYFCNTYSSIGGIGIDLLEKEAVFKHKQAFMQEHLISKGEYNWRMQGEKHLYNPTTIHLLQQASWKNDYKIYQEFSRSVNNTGLYKLRNLLKFKSTLKTIELNEVEGVAEIAKRFCTGAMSIGAISRESHEDLAIAMNSLGAKSNTGEGGEDATRYKLSADGSSKNSKIKQIASGRFGVTSYYLNNAEEIQIKIAQGAKPGEGGQIKGLKVDSYIAKLRHTVEGIALISPPPHHDIYSIEDLAQLIYDLKNANPKVAVSVKLVASQGVGTIAAGVVKAKADKIIIAGFDGGTGASPASSIKNAGIPWELGIVETQQMLVSNRIRDRVTLQIDGQITTGRDVVVGALFGAEEFGFSTAALVTQGCILMRKCHLNTCPVGIATQDKNLRAKYKGKPEYVRDYLLMVAREAREIMASLGIRKFDDLIGQVQFLEINQKRHNAKSKELDLSFLLQKVVAEKSVYKKIREQSNMLENALDKKLIQISQTALEEGKKIRFSMNIKNTQRAVGTMLGHQVTQKYGEQGLLEDTISIDFSGTAGQSFGAFLPPGISLHIKGDANDYLGKGLCGGKIVVQAINELQNQASKNAIVGNTVLYGATGGKTFLNGSAGERFAVRNSGAMAVVEGVGEHGCEYMTGGVVIVLGKIGRNFAAGMSDGEIYIYDDLDSVKSNCNLSCVEVLKMQKEDKQFWSLLTEHFLLTKSRVAEEILANKKAALKKFTCVVSKLTQAVYKQKAS